jgi:hypothetical protein
VLVDGTRATVVRARETFDTLVEHERHTRELSLSAAPHAALEAVR